MSQNILQQYLGPNPLQDISVPRIFKHIFCALWCMLITLHGNLFEEATTKVSICLQCSSVGSCATGEAIFLHELVMLLFLIFLTEKKCPDYTCPSEYLLLLS